MDQPYSVVADWLSKFHTWPEPIQALWIVAIPITVLGVTWLTTRALRDLVSLARPWRGRLVYGIYQDHRGRWMLYQPDRLPQELAPTGPPELIGRGEAIRDAFGGTEE